jgi:hypothetical protein
MSTKRNTDAPEPGDNLDKMLAQLGALLQRLQWDDQEEVGTPVAQAMPKGLNTGIPKSEENLDKLMTHLGALLQRPLEDGQGNSELKAFPLNFRKPGNPCTESDIEVLCNHLQGLSLGDASEQDGRKVEKWKSGKNGKSNTSKLTQKITAIPSTRHTLFITWIRKPHRYITGMTCRYSSVLYSPPPVLADSVWTPCGLRTDSIHSFIFKNSYVRVRPKSARTPHGLSTDSARTQHGLPRISLY